MDSIVYLLFGVALVILGGAVLAWIDFFRVRRLRHALAQVNARLDRLEGRRGSSGAPEPAPPPVPDDAPETPTSPWPGPTAPADGLERALTVRWLVWVGAVALVLAGVFLVEYSIDSGWLGPATRCALGALSGIALALAGEWLRRSDRSWSTTAAVDPAVALTAAGVSVLFTSIYAAHALYGLISGPAAFALLAGTAALAWALALLHGSFVATLGVTGGYLVPALVATDAPSAPALFSFLAVVTGAALWTVRYRGWRYIAWLALAGAAAWPAVWFLTAWQATDVLAVGIYLALATVLFLHVRPVAEAGTREGEATGAGVAGEGALVAAAAGLFAVLVFALVRVDAYGAVSVAVLGAVCAVLLDAGRRTERYDLLGVLALGLAVALFATWHIEAVTDAAGKALGVEGWRYDLGRRLLPPALTPFLSLSALFAALFAAAGFLGLRQARRPWLWAALSAAAPVALLAVAFWRIRAFEVDLAWAAAALGIAVLQVFAAEQVARRRDRRGMDGALAAYALGAVSALGLAMAMSLQQAWLTIALSLQVPALAAIYDRTLLAGLRRAALAVAAVTIVRLVFNIHVLDYASGAAPGPGWMVYGYGVPLIGFWWAARRFGARRRDTLVRVLEAGALAFGVLLVGLQARDWASGSEAAAAFGFLERSLLAAALLALAWGLYRGADGARRDFPGWGWRLLGGGGAVWLIAVQVLDDGPLSRAFDAGAWPGFNLLLLAYGLPALIAFAFFREAATGASGTDRLVRRSARLATMLLIFVLLTLEVRQAFHGGVLAGAGIDGEVRALAPASDAEWYAYSLAWLAYAGVLLAIGLWRGHAVLRHASLVLIVLAVAKLFLFDMSALAGLYRVASFLGLGLSLVGIGYLYQRFVFPPRAPAPSGLP